MQIQLAVSHDHVTLTPSQPVQALTPKDLVGKPVEYQFSGHWLDWTRNLLPGGGGGGGSGGSGGGAEGWGGGSGVLILHLPLSTGPPRHNGDVFVGLPYYPSVITVFLSTTRSPCCLKLTMGNSNSPSNSDSVFGLPVVPAADSTFAVFDSHHCPQQRWSSRTISVNSWL